jgi:acylphosphatase
MPCIRCVVSGRVQGVFFRAETREEAERLGVSGWVRNLPGGQVEVLACGSESQLAALRQWLRRGPALARVRALQCESQPEQVYAGFEVRRW